MEDSNTTDSAALAFKNAIPIAFADHYSPFKSDEFWCHIKPQPDNAEGESPSKGVLDAAGHYLKKFKR